MNLGSGEDRVENFLWRAVNFPLPSPVKNIAILCRINKIPIDTPRDTADCIISIGSTFWKKSDNINVSVCGLIPRDEFWSVNSVVINEVNEILKYQCNINSVVFIFEDRGWNLANGTLYCSLFYKDLLHLIERGNVKLARSITLAITPRYNNINLSSTNSNISYSDITRKIVQISISFPLNECDFSPLSNVCKPTLYQHKTASCVTRVNVHVSLVYASSVSELAKPLMYVTPVVLIISLNP